MKRHKTAEKTRWVGTMLQIIHLCPNCFVWAELSRIQKCGEKRRRTTNFLCNYSRFERLLRLREHFAFRNDKLTCVLSKLHELNLWMRHNVRKMEVPQMDDLRAGKRQFTWLAGNKKTKFFRLKAGHYARMASKVSIKSSADCFDYCLLKERIEACALLVEVYLKMQNQTYIYFRQRIMNNFRKTRIRGSRNWDDREDKCHGSCHGYFGGFRGGSWRPIWSILQQFRPQQYSW